MTEYRRFRTAVATRAFTRTRLGSNRHIDGSVVLFTSQSGNCTGVHCTVHTACCGLLDNAFYTAFNSLIYVIFVTEGRRLLHSVIRKPDSEIGITKGHARCPGTIRPYCSQPRKSEYCITILRLCSPPRTRVNWINGERQGARSIKSRLLRKGSQLVVTALEAC